MRRDKLLWMKSIYIWERINHTSNGLAPTTTKITIALTGNSSKLNSSLRVYHDYGWTQIQRWPCEAKLHVSPGHITALHFGPQRGTCWSATLWQINQVINTTISPFHIISNEWFSIARSSYHKVSSSAWSRTRNHDMGVSRKQSTAVIFIVYIHRPVSKSCNTILFVNSWDEGSHS